MCVYFLFSSWNTPIFFSTLLPTTMREIHVPLETLCKVVRIWGGDYAIYYRCNVSRAFGKKHGLLTLPPPNRYILSWSAWQQGMVHINYSILYAFKKSLNSSSTVTFILRYISRKVHQNQLAPPPYACCLVRLTLYLSSEPWQMVGHIADSVIPSNDPSKKLWFLVVWINPSYASAHGLHPVFDPWSGCKKWEIKGCINGVIFSIQPYLQI